MDYKDWRTEGLQPLISVPSLFRDIHTCWSYNLWRWLSQPLSYNLWQWLSQTLELLPVTDQLSYFQMMHWQWLHSVTGTPKHHDLYVPAWHLSCILWGWSTFMTFRLQMSVRACDFRCWGSSILCNWYTHAPHPFVWSSPVTGPQGSNAPGTGWFGSLCWEGRHTQQLWPL